ncbi:MmcQ/YjbR family DNA-binding protein [Nitratireductor basaltis]|uniref:MmcQ/YjbR family DNA-binding protein n=1 Tax=Nitratireductor basaltis TaxID=472175 RepID=A0A084U7P9_9HYPH|nr:MmcQ/YjbR family DNA-binding protein [Nitratireductor basaltis]KFB08985.1 hypothetical protein EL18_03242 [Nitratireductor basaltis]
MEKQAFNRFCSGFAAATHVVQWGGAEVWKVGGKVFAIGSSQDGSLLAVTFKCSPAAYDILQEQPGLRPAPYLASRGMKWIQRTGRESMDDAALEDYIRESYRLVVAKLPLKTRRELGIKG